MELVTIFYSNYSGNCKALFQYLKNSNLMNSLSIKFINIDNSSIKEEVLKKTRKGIIGKANVAVGKKIIESIIAKVPDPYDKKKKS